MEHVIDGVRGPVVKYVEFAPSLEHSCDCSNDMVVVTVILHQVICLWSHKSACCMTSLLKRALILLSKHTEEIWWLDLESVARVNISYSYQQALAHGVKLDFGFHTGPASSFTPVYKWHSMWKHSEAVLKLNDWKCVNLVPVWVIWDICVTVFLSSLPIMVYVWYVALTQNMALLLKLIKLP